MAWLQEYCTIDQVHLQLFVIRVICRYPSVSSSHLNLQSLRHPNKETYSAITAYGASKLCNLLFMLEFHRRYNELGVACNAVHPGNLLPTNLMRNAGCAYFCAFSLARMFTRTVVSVCVGDSAGFFSGLLPN